jgi:hypothetical protein
MLFFVTGLPGRFSEWCDAVTGRCAERGRQPTAAIQANTIEELTLAAMKLGTSQAVIAARQPGGLLRRALVEALRPFIVALDDPRGALADLVSRRGVGMAMATRQVASSCASVISFHAAPGALVLRADRDGKDQLSTADAIARHLQLDITDGEIAEIVGSLGGGDDVLDPDEIAAWWEGLDPGERAMASGALGPYLDQFAGRGVGPISWAPELFFVGDRPGVSATGGVDITGRARCLLRGPHIMLPPATWSLSLAVDVSPEAAEHSFVVEATAGGVVGRTVIHPTGVGVIETDLTLVLDDLPDQPVELLLSNERPAFGGHLTLVRVTLTPQSLSPSDMPAEAAADDPRTAAR